MGLKTFWVKAKLKSDLMRCFRDGKIVKTVKRGDQNVDFFPQIHDVFVDEEKKAVRFVFTLKSGMDPELLTKREWVFRQVFGENIELSGKTKKFTLWVYSKGMPDNVKYVFEDIQPHLEELFMPLVIGYDRRNNLICLDLKEIHHAILTGSTGSGKSSLFRAILVSIMLYKSPQDVQFLLIDMKNSEFGIYRGGAHVKEVLMDQESVLKALQQVEAEMHRRSKLLDSEDVEHVADLEKKLPVIMVVIDEIIALVDNKKIMKILTNLSCLGRSAGVHIIGAMQSGRAKDVGGQFLNNMNCRISGKQSDATNAKVAGFTTAKNISTPGRMVLSLDGVETHVQVPFMDKQRAKKLLQPFKGKVIQDPNSDIQVSQSCMLEEIKEHIINEFTLEGMEEDE
ncbi:hypothetical protein COL23_25715 [Priestia aryabhattai]|uniref:FtsK/SpoIIIE domain-containing protein n=1 Tax=Priestia aryabhattai TaxID=412384 RepID=UPI000BF9CB7F|nr:FtsK/SpoIIIE domain-containing protein [Priestia aryabhattai]PFW72151.1 hypothetical protein COL23_25715 [Priestia aryabhattai]